MLKQRRAGLSRRRLLLVASLATFTVVCPATASAATVYHNTFKGTNVTASFVDYDACGYTQTYVFANSGQNKDSVTGHSASSVASVFVDSFDFCTNQAFYAIGSVDLAPGQLTVDHKLATATLTTVVPAFEFYGQSTVNLTVALTWTATSGPFSSKSRTSQTFPDGSKVTYSSSGTSRQASASGTVSDGTRNFTPTASSLADINSTKSGSLSITK